MVLVIGQNSVWQKTYFLDHLVEGKVNRVKKVKGSAAGKGGNVSRVLRGEGIDCLLLAYAGGRDGQKFKEDIKGDSIPAEYVTIQGETRTCTTLISEDGEVTELVEPPPGVTKGEREKYLRLFMQFLGEASFLVISGTAISGELDECYRTYVEAAKKKGIPVLLDSYKKHGRLAMDASPDILKVNREEIEEITGMDFTGRTERERVYRKVMEDYHITWIIVTKGHEGAEGSNGKEIVSVTNPRVDLVNSIGSGDSVTAGIVSVLVKGDEGVDPFKGKHTGKDGRKMSDFQSPGLLEEALKCGVTLGTANCLSWKPGHIEEEHRESIMKQITVSISEMHSE